MLLAYLHVAEAADAADLCIFAEKPDQFSIPARISKLTPTDAGVYRSSAQEAFCVRKDAKDGALIIEPVKPGKLFLTPDLPDQPGIAVKAVKIIVKPDGGYQSFYVMDRHAEGDWQTWNPLIKRV